MAGAGRFAANVLGAPWMGWLLRLPPWRGTLVLGYHRILEDGTETPLDPAVVSATRSDFAEQLRLIVRHLQVVGSDALADPGDQPARQVMLTFDDGYRDNYEVAFPVLREHGARATFFLATGFLDRPHVAWWDELAWMVRSSPREMLEAGEWLPGPVALDGDRRSAIGQLTRVYKALDTERTEAFLEYCAEATGSGRCPDALAKELWMTWEMAAEMRDAGMEIGGHTVTHPILARADEDRQRTEIDDCRGRLHDELGTPMRSFAYPVGLRNCFGDTTKRLLREAGVQHAFSLYGGYMPRRAADPYDVPRASIGRATDPSAFRAKLIVPRVFAQW
jgi:peptidoglycan/xylan/chitin deacetylase (PgdA/CDA1 family)